MSSVDEPVWVLLRGLTRGNGHWAGLPDRLRERIGPARIVMLDLPGNGARHGEASATRIGAMTDACRTQLQSLGCAPPYRLLAVSLGAMVAVDWATRAPHELTGAVLINTSLRPFNPWYERLRPSAWAGLAQVALWPMSDAARERLVLRLTSRHASAAAAVLHDWAALRASQPATRLNALRQVMAAARYQAPLHAPAVPLLMMSSARDALVHPRCSSVLSASWHSARAVHPSAGHDLPLDDATWVVEQIARWIAREAQRGGAV